MPAAKNVCFGCRLKIAKLQMPFYWLVVTNVYSTVPHPRFYTIVCVLKSFLLSYVITLYNRI